MTDPLQTLRDALGDSPENLPLRQHLAESLVGLGRLDEAEQEYRQAVGLAPGNSKFRVGLAEVSQRLDLQDVKRAGRGKAFAGERTVAVLNELHALGISFSIDDFGTGYSSLSYLKRFPIDILKIDQSFMRGIPGNAEDTAIARAIIVMAHGLGIKTIAEGVETEAQFSFLRAHQCDGIQGFYFSPAVPAEAITRLLETKRTLEVTPEKL